jgi:hypothetical protein
MAEKIEKALAGLKEFLLGFLPDWLKDLLGIDGGKGPDAAISEAAENRGKAISEARPSVDGILGGIRDAGGAVKDFGSGLLAGAGSFLSSINPFGGDSSEGVRPAAVAGPVDNSSETNVNVGGITVNAQSTDAAGIARETGAEFRRMTAAENSSWGF